ncbi:MAG: hypothetical protein HZB65_02475 [Candidatus Aenigmarchaeota archaeon]|nr:hypothetical protein [Candidatus Aenigmarchaeota archaeon]
MVNPELARQLLKELEKEVGGPVQLRADTPESERYVDGQIHGRQYFGAFSKRGVSVRRVDDLEKKYMSDVALIEGEYESLEHLQKRIEELNALYDYPASERLAERVYKLVQEKTGIRDLVCNGLSWNFKEMHGFGKIAAEMVYKILDNAGMMYLKHNIAARSDGVYDNRTSGGTLCEVDETKIADVFLKLIE